VRPAELKRYEAGRGVRLIDRCISNDGRVWQRVEKQPKVRKESEESNLPRRGAFAMDQLRRERVFFIDES
jgi:hypothetical protein